MALTQIKTDSISANAITVDKLESNLVFDNLSVNNNFTANGTSIFSTILEKINISATAATGTVNFDTLSQSVLFYTSNTSGNWTLNVRGNETFTINSMMNVGQSLTIAFLATNGTTAYKQSALSVDNTAVTPLWLGGTAPSSGSANAVDCYSLTLIKTGNAAFTALESFSKYS